MNYRVERDRSPRNISEEKGQRSINLPGRTSKLFVFDDNDRYSMELEAAGNNQLVN